MDDLIPIIVQARTGSQRCPGKVMRVVAGRRLIDYTLDALELCRAGRPVIVATSSETEDDALAAHCTARMTPVIRGALHDVAGRFRTVLQQFPVRGFVRVSGDSPLIDHRLVDRAVDLFRTQSVDMVSNVVERTFPKGQSVEVISSHIFLKAEAELTSAEDREHVTTCFYRQKDRFSILSLKSDENLGQASMVIDTEAEFARFKTIAHQLQNPAWRYRWNELAPRFEAAQ